MRITGGRARGIPLSTGRAREVRPATDRMREAVFSSLGPKVEGARFLDLFAGSGSYGLEAFSRGATGGLFVEKHPAACAALEENLRAVCKSMGSLSPGPLRVVRRDVFKFDAPERFPLVFLDPPYELARSHCRDLLEKAATFLDQTENSTLILELPADLLPDLTGWQTLRRIGKGGTNEPSVLILTRAT